MKPWERTFAKVHEDLEREAEKTGGKISKDFLETTIILNVGKDRRRTVPDAIEQLCRAKVLRPENQFSFLYLMDGFEGYAKKKLEKEIKKELETVLGARA